MRPALAGYAGVRQVIRIMRHGTTIVAAIGLICCVLAGCSDDERITCPKLDVPCEELSEEARFMALCLSGELEPPCELAKRIERDLMMIRERFANEYDELASIDFCPPWDPSRMTVAFDSLTSLEVQEGSYHAWDELNDQFRLVSSRLQSYPGITVAGLGFDGTWHPCLVAAAYAGLPGVAWADPSSFVAVSTTIYPRVLGEDMSYLFRRGLGFDCPAGCPGEYLYFVVSGCRVRLIGTWNQQDEGERPSWWSDAGKNEALWVHWSRCDSVTA
jgi:hypothetical protein